MENKPTVIVTGASQGIGEAIVQIFLDRGYNVVAAARSMSKAGLAASPSLALVDGDITQQATSDKVTQTAISTFGSIDHLVNNAGIFKGKAFTDYTGADFHNFTSINLGGFVLMTQLAVKQMLAQGRGGSVTTITAALADNPMTDSPAAIAMMTKGGLNAATISLAIEYAKRNIRFNAVAPGVVDSPLHAGNSIDALKSSTPMGIVAEPKDIAEAVVYLTEARYVTGEVLHVDGGAHVGRW